MYDIRMSHPRKNALGTALMDWLECRLEAAHGEPLLLTGSGDAFSAGLDLEELAALEAGSMAPFLRRIDRLAVRFFEYPAPTVASINGHAIAGGCVLAQCCDYRVARDDEGIKIGLNEVALGACFPPAVRRLVAWRLPNVHRERVLLGAGLFAPRTALELGLVDELAHDPEERARAVLAALARHPRESYGITKLALRAGVAEVTPEDETRFTEQELGLWTSDALKQRVLRALGK